MVTILWRRFAPPRFVGRPGYDGRSTFTLVELMFTIGIVAMLAAVAVSGFMRMKWRAQHAEAPLVFDGMSAAALSMWAQSDTDLDVIASFACASIQSANDVPDGRAHAWGPSCANGYAPDGDVFGSYVQDNCVAGALLCGGTGLVPSCGVDGSFTFSAAAVFDADRDLVCGRYHRLVDDGAVTLYEFGANEGKY